MAVSGREVRGYRGQRVQRSEGTESSHSARAGHAGVRVHGSKSCEDILQKSVFIFLFVMNV